MTNIQVQFITVTYSPEKMVPFEKKVAHNLCVLFEFRSLFLVHFNLLKGIFIIFSATNNWLFSFVSQPLHGTGLILARSNLVRRLFLCREAQVHKGMHFLRVIKYKGIIYEDKNQYHYLIYIISSIRSGYNGTLAEGVRRVGRERERKRVRERKREWEESPCEFVPIKWNMIWAVHFK